MLRPQKYIVPFCICSYKHTPLVPTGEQAEGDVWNLERVTNVWNLVPGCPLFQVRKELGAQRSKPGFQVCLASVVCGLEPTVCEVRDGSPTISKSLSQDCVTLCGEEGFSDVAMSRISAGKIILDPGCPA